MTSAPGFAPTAPMMAGGGPDLRPRERDAWGPGVALAAVAHVLLVAALAWGVSWRSHESEEVSAEIWSAIPEAEAPPPVVVVPQPPPPQVVDTPQAEPDTVPDLVIAKRKAPKEPKPERKHREVEVFDSTPVKPRKTDPMQPPPQVREQQAREQAARDKAAKEAEAKAQAQRDAAQQAAMEAQRQRILKDIVRNAGGGSASANPNATGQAAANSGPSTGYSGRLRALFKRNLINWSPDDLPGNPEVVVRVTVAPDGTILSRTVVTPSGVPVWDEAVLRAIDRTEVIPRDENGRVHSPMTLSFRPKDY